MYANQVVEKIRIKVTFLKFHIQCIATSSRYFKKTSIDILILSCAFDLTKKKNPFKDELSIMYVWHATFPLRRWLILT